MQINTFFDFCSGIGGGRLGLENCGLKCVGHSDTSRLSDSTYMQIFDTCHDKNYGNLKKLNEDNLPKFDLLIAGFPCQTFSVIGRKAGFNDDRGQIIFHLIRILNETRPKCFILENVRGLVTHDKGKTIKIIMKEFKKIGYHVSYRIITSLEHGVPQMRQRVYFVGFDEKIGLYGDGFEWIIPEDKPELKDYLIDTDNEISEENLTKFRYYLKNPTNKGLYEPEDFLCEEYLIIDTRMSDLRLYRGRVPTLRSQRDGIFYIRDHKIRELTGYEALLLQGFPKEYANKVKSTVTNRHLLMQAGNAMTVNVIEKLGKSILKHIQKGEFKMSKKEKEWAKFEVEATNYLNEKYGDFANFIHQGGADSTKPDILVETKKGTSFYIEAKCSKAQCGQFVLQPDIVTSTFKYTAKNPINQYAEEIIDFMNNDFEAFKEAGTKGKDIEMDPSVFVNWITKIYKDKNVKFYITDNFVFVPIDKFAEFFDVTAKYRVKRSGSTDIGKTKLDNVIEHIKTLKIHSLISEYQKSDKKLFVKADKDIHNLRFIFDGFEYMFSRRDNCYEVRRLSNTFNSNVIFSISLKYRTDKYDKAFVSSLS